MTDRTLVGRCGFYCGACGIFRAERGDPDYRNRLASHFKCPPEKIRCKGCGALSTECWGNECKFIKYLNEKEYLFCYECPEYGKRTCSMFEEFSRNYLQEDGVDLRKNLAMIKVGKIDEWLIASKEFYTC